MSIKRTKQKTFGAGRRDEAAGPSLFDDEQDAGPEKTWDELTAGQPDEAFVPYVMSSRYPKGALIHHAKFGRGAVVRTDSSNMEVVFEGGKKKLGHGIV